MKFQSLRYIAVSLFMIILSGCGGGGGNGSQSSSSSGPNISMLVQLMPSGVNNGLKYIARGSVGDPSTGTPLSSANVTINNSPLTFDANLKSFTGTVTPDSSGKLNLLVTVNEKTYTATQDAPDNLLTLNIPFLLDAASSNTITWTPNISSHGLTPISYRVITASPSGTPFDASTTSTSMAIPENTLTVGITYCISVVSQYTTQPIANASNYSVYSVYVDSYVCKTAQ